MTEANAEPPPTLAALATEPLALAMSTPDRRFWYGLAAAVLLHAMFLVGINAAKPQRLGGVDGVENAISISLVTAEDLESRATVEDHAAGTPAPPPPLAEQTPPTLPEPPRPEAKEAETPQADPPPEPAAKPLAEPPRAAASLPEIGTDTAQPAGEVKPAPAAEAPRTLTPAKPQEQKPAVKPPPKKAASLDLNAPPSAFTGRPGGGGAGMERPPGITRSGANDAFGRGVVRALQQTMPQLDNTFGRVTVRITLDMTGNLVRTEVVKPSNVAGLDQSVMFATKQTNYPLPPGNANTADLVFLITYIYR